MRFTLMTPCYNVEPWVEWSLAAARGQVTDPKKIRVGIGLEVEPFSVLHLLADDESTDATSYYIEEARMNGPAATSSDYAGTFSWLPKRQGALWWYWHMISTEVADDDVVVFYDGDDWFPHPYVLAMLAEQYADPDCWATYGSFAYDARGGGGRGMASPMPAENHCRRAGWRCTHLKTARAQLLKKVDPVRDLCWPDGSWFDASGDLALFYPVIEMSGPRRARYLNDLMYVYNTQNRGNESHTKREEQIRVQRYIESMPIYLPIERLEDPARREGD